ncbi:MAG: hypothetical protein D6761_03435 [Candidatus Dadabacteria bacterium]|nr:MAG: hypothetical protein D6761_03435 [Candidatus Dadabacteria bacterium]
MFFGAACTQAQSDAACQLQGPYGSTTELANALLDGLRQSDKSALHRLLISETEFRQQLWPRFPASSPDWNVPVTDAWTLHAASTEKALERALRDWGGVELHLRRIGFRGPKQDYGSFELYRKAVIEAETATGDVVELDFTGSVVACGNGVKLLSYRD